MKKILVFLVMLGLVVGMSGVVLGEEGPISGSATVTVGESSVEVTLTPTEITFGDVTLPITDYPATILEVVISTLGDANNLDIDVDVDVQGVVFENGLKFNDEIAEGNHYDMDCVPDETTGVCAYTDITLAPTLSMPLGVPAGLQTGTIIYTITGMPHTFS